MVFSSVPVYLDPTNWQQQQQQQQNHDHHHQIQNHHPHNLPAQAPTPPPPPPGGPGPAKPGSMAERARQAKIPQPEAALKCPRCESTNTKFCYFNNYSLAQPRHFCKTCRRYWTRGGALRSVPVGGGCRRNKRSSSSSSSSKSKPIAGGPNDHGPVSLPPPPAHSAPFLPPIDHYGGLGFPAAVPGEIIFPAEPWRHFPFLGPASYPNSDSAVKVEGVVGVSDQLGLNNNNNVSNNNNLSRNFLGVLGNIDHDDHHHHHYGTSTITTTTTTTTGFMGSSNAWTDHLSGFTTSSSTNHNLI